MKIDWKAKLSSRKFWALLAALAVSIFSGILPGGDVTRIVSIISAVGACAIYMLAESSVDAANVSTAGSTTDSTTEVKNE